MIYVAYGQLEDREVLIGYFSGNQNDIESFVYHKYGTNYYSVEIRLIEPTLVPPGFSEDIRKLEKEKYELECQLRRLNCLIDLKR